MSLVSTLESTHGMGAGAGRYVCLRKVQNDVGHAVWAPEG